MTSAIAVTPRRAPAPAFELDAVYRKIIWGIPCLPMP